MALVDRGNPKLDLCRNLDNQISRIGRDFGSAAKNRTKKFDSRVVTIFGFDRLDFFKALIEQNQFFWFN